MSIYPENFQEYYAVEQRFHQLQQEYFPDGGFGCYSMEHILSLPEKFDPAYFRTFKKGLMSLPSAYHFIQHWLAQLVDRTSTDWFFDEGHNLLRAFHGTVSPFLPDIAQQGLLSFEEIGVPEPRIYVTPSPVTALKHVLEKGPRDTWVNRGLIPREAVRGEPVIMQLEIPLDWLLQQPQCHSRVGYDTSGIRYGICGEESTRLEDFLNDYGGMTKALFNGCDAVMRGSSFPIDAIPPNYIFVCKNDFTLEPVASFGT